MVAQHPAFFRQLAVGGEDHAAFPGGDDLVPEEAERGDITEGAGGFTMISGAEGFRRILNQVQLVPVADGAQGPHVGGMPIEMNGHDRLGAWGDGAFDRGGVQVP